jgi:type II secretory pathway component PulF
LLYHSGVAPGSAWTAAAGAVPNEELAARLAAETHFVNAGGRFSEAMRRSGVFRDHEAGMVATGESAGSVEELLAKVADFEAMEVEAAVHRLPFIARLTFLVVGALVTAVAAGMAWKAFYMAIFRAFSSD